MFSTTIQSISTRAIIDENNNPIRKKSTPGGCWFPGKLSYLPPGIKNTVVFTSIVYLLLLYEPLYFFIPISIYTSFITNLMDLRLIQGERTGQGFVVAKRSVWWHQIDTKYLFYEINIIA